jgi:uncharacterized protein (DUF924 family)/NAD(P)H-dependent FMN reductase
MDKPRIGIVISTIREGRFGERPARWILDIASEREDLDCEIVDLRDYPLPLFGERDSSSYDGSSGPEVASRFKQKMAELDGYLFVTAEYNHSVPGVLKNALDHAYPEFNKKPAAFVGYGGVGGARAVEQLRLICIELQMAPTRTAVHIGMEPYLGVTQEDKELSDFDFLGKSAVATLDELAWWTHTLKAGRVEEATMDREVEEVIEFWFGSEGETGDGEFREEWFAADPEFDREIRERFLETYAQARAGKLDHWLEHPRSALALVIVLDQLSRNMFRGTPGMYEADEKARAVARSSLENGFDQELPPFQRWFLYMPSLHSEDLEDQRRAVELFQRLEDHQTRDDRYQEWHLKAIERFGRFPHRNEILGRQSTPEEVEFLAEQDRSRVEA